MISRLSRTETHRRQQPLTVVPRAGIRLRFGGGASSTTLVVDRRSYLLPNGLTPAFPPPPPPPHRVWVRLVEDHPWPTVGTVNSSTTIVIGRRDFKLIDRPAGIRRRALFEEIKTGQALILAIRSNTQPSRWMLPVKHQRVRAGSGSETLCCYFPFALSVATRLPEVGPGVAGSITWPRPQPLPDPPAPASQTGMIQPAASAARLSGFPPSAWRSPRRQLIRQGRVRRRTGISPEQGSTWQVIDMFSSPRPDPARRVRRFPEYAARRHQHSDCFQAFRPTSPKNYATDGPLPAGSAILRNVMDIRFIQHLMSCAGRRCLNRSGAPHATPVMRQRAQSKNTSRGYQAWKSPVQCYFPASTRRNFEQVQSPQERTYL